ncbi:hypothetical protein GZH53_05665 [Flavihumibacter sp. R14]|nr:hypothetical protein [Flavihumibacter soli]
MGSFYRLQIQCDRAKKKKIDSILGESIDDPQIGWSLVIDEDSPRFGNALSIFIDLVNGHLIELKEIGVAMDKITFWYLYEYEQQCNMEFWPDITRRIGELGIVLCISCWEK